MGADLGGQCDGVPHARDTLTMRSGRIPVCPHQVVGTQVADEGDRDLGVVRDICFNYGGDVEGDKS